MRRKIYRVYWRGSAWAVRHPRDRRPIRCAGKKDALQVAKWLAFFSRAPGQVIVHGKNGRIQTEWTYGSDPRRTRG